MTLTTQQVQDAYVAHTGTATAAADFDAWLHQVAAQVADGVSSSNHFGTVTVDHAARALAHAAAIGSASAHQLMWDAAVEELRDTCTSLPESATQVLTAVTRYLRAGGSPNELSMRAQVMGRFR